MVDGEAGGGEAGQVQKAELGPDPWTSELCPSHCSSLPWLRGRDFPEGIVLARGQAHLALAVGDRDPRLDPTDGQVLECAHGSSCPGSQRSCSVGWGG